MELWQSLNYYLDVAQRRFLFFLIPFVLTAVAGFGVVLILPSVYTAQANILVESQQIPTELVKSTVTTEASERIQVIRQRVLTRNNILTIVKKFGLLADRQELSATEIVDIIRERIIIVPLDIDLSDRRRRDDRITIAFTVSFDDENPTSALNVTNELVTLILNEDVRSRANSASETTKFLEKEAKRLAEELTLVELQISDFKHVNSGSLPEKLVFNMGLLERTEKSISDIDLELVALGDEKRKLEFELQEKASTGAGSSADERKALSDKLHALKTELVEKAALYSPSHPDIKALRVKVDALETQIDAISTLPEPVNTSTASPLNTDQRLIAQKIIALDEKRAVYVKQREELVKVASSLKEIVNKTPETGSGLAILERKQAALQKSLEEVSEKYSTARLGERLEQDQQAERFEVIEHPALPQEPTKPDRNKLFAFTLGLAVMAGAGMAFVVESMDRRIRRIGDIANKRSRPLVVLPYIRTRREIRRSRIRIATSTLVLSLVIIGSIIVVHYFVLPLDLLLTNIVERMRP